MIRLQTEFRLKLDQEGECNHKSNHGKVWQESEINIPVCAEHIALWITGRNASVSPTYYRKQAQIGLKAFIYTIFLLTFLQLWVGNNYWNYWKLYIRYFSKSIECVCYVYRMTKFHEFPWRCIFKFAQNFCTFPVIFRNKIRDVLISDKTSNLNSFYINGSII